MDIRMKIQEMVKNQMNQCMEEQLSENVKLIQDLDFDSVQMVSLLVDLEDYFQIEFQSVDMLYEHFETLGDLCNLVERLVQKSRQEKNDISNGTIWH